MGGEGSGRPPGVKGLVDRQLGRNSNNTILPAGDGFIIPNLSGDHSAGTTGTPVDDRDIANKAYVDSVGGGAPEGTAVKSTGEVGGTKFLREDGDGTSSWQPDNDTTDHTALSNIGTNSHAQIDTSITATGLNTTHRSSDGSDHADVVTNTAKVSFTKTEIKGVINHGGTASKARPTGLDSVEWI